MNITETQMNTTLPQETCKWKHYEEKYASIGKMTVGCNGYRKFLPPEYIYCPFCGRKIEVQE